jgi:ribose-phosphate pyrophosphokinase
MAIIMSKRVINLDPNFRPINIPSIKFTAFTFPGGERHIRLNPLINYGPIKEVTITCRPRNMGDIMDILLVSDALHQLGVSSRILYIPYFPYARQDRVCAKGDPFSLSIMADLINSCGFDKVITHDIHSDKIGMIVDNFRNIGAISHVEKAMELIGNPNIRLISPDKGAFKRVHNIAIDIGVDLPVECGKDRDPESGSISGFYVKENDLHGDDCLIIDDICDGGGTFLGLAKELKRKNAGKLYLYVTHGIFSKGYFELTNAFEHIYTTNSFADDVFYKDVTRFDI